MLMCRIAGSEIMKISIDNFRIKRVNESFFLLCKRALLTHKIYCHVRSVCLCVKKWQQSLDEEEER